MFELILSMLYVLISFCPPVIQLFYVFISSYITDFQLNVQYYKANTIIYGAHFIKENHICMCKAFNLIYLLQLFGQTLYNYFIYK